MSKFKEMAKRIASKLDDDDWNDVYLFIDSAEEEHESLERELAQHQAVIKGQKETIEHVRGELKLARQGAEFCFNQAKEADANAAVQNAAVHCLTEKLDGAKTMYEVMSDKVDEQSALIEKLCLALDCWREANLEGEISTLNRAYELRAEALAAYNEWRAK